MSKEKLTKIAIIPNIENKTLQESRESFLKYIPGKTAVFLKNKELLTGRLDVFYTKAEEAFNNLYKEIKHAKQIDVYCNGDYRTKQMRDTTLVSFGNEKNLDKVDSYNNKAIQDEKREKTLKHNTTNVKK